MFLLFDIGGTNTRIATSRDGISIESLKITATPKNFSEGITVFRHIAQELVGGEKIMKVAGGVAGPLNKEKSAPLCVPALPAWSAQPLKKELENILKAQVLLENDAALAGLAEATTGAGKGYRIVAYLTIGTGVGGVRIVNGNIDANAAGFEPGHQIIDIEGRQDSPIKNPRYLDDYISGGALERRYNQRAEYVTDPAIWDGLARHLAIGLNNTIVHWSPDIVVLGGSMITKQPGISLPSVEKYLKNFLWIYETHPPITTSLLGDTAGLYGALLYLKQYESP